MALEEIHKFDQSTMGGMHDRGSCYNQCEFVGTKDLLWGKVKTYQEAYEKAKAFKTYKTLMNFAHSRRSQDWSGKNQVRYSAVAAGLNNNSIYRAELFVGAAGDAVGAANHEIILATNAGSANGGTITVCFFDPNLGFYAADAQAAAAGAAPAAPAAGSNNRQILEHYVTELYGGASVIGAFGYLRSKALT